MKALRIVAACLAALVLLQAAAASDAHAHAQPEDEYYPSFGHLEDEDEQPALMEEQTSSQLAAERSEAEAQMGVEYWGAPTTFVSTNHPYPLPPVMYDSCGRPLCPAKPAPLPPRAYICDCRRPKEHPDCGCDRDTMQCGCDTGNPHWRCGCNIPSQPVAIVCDCNSEEDPHPACGCNRLPRRRKHLFKPYLPSSGMHYLPPLSTDECRPNVLEYGPGNCLSTGEETDDFCSSSDSNCQTPAVQPVCRSRDCPRRWAREAYCQCREAAPAPCECQRPPFSAGAYRRAAFFSRSLPAPSAFGNFGLGPQGAPSPDAECMCLGEPKCSCDPSQWQDTAGAYPYPYANNNQSPYYYGSPSGSGSSSYPSANICPCLGRPACGCAPPPPSTCPCPGTGAPRCPCVQWQEDPYVRPPPNIYDNRRYRHRRFWHRRDSCKCEGRPNCMCARQVDSLCGCTGQPNCGCSVATTPQCGCAGQSGCPCSSMAAPPPSPPPAAPLAPLLQPAPSACGCMGQPNCGCQQQQQQQQSACGCMGQPNCGCQQQQQACGCTGQPNCVCSQQIPPCPCVGQKNCTCEEAFKAAQMAAALSYVYQQTKVSGSPYAVNPLTGQSMLTTPFTQPNDLKATDGGSSMIMHTAGTIYDAQGRSVPINPAKIIIEPTILFRHADGTLHSTPQPPRAKPGVNPDALPSTNDLLTGPNDAELRRQEEQLRDEEKDIKREMIKEQEIQEKHKQKMQSENEFEQKEKADVASQSADLIKRLREKRTANELTEFAAQQKAEKRKKKDQAIKTAAANVNLSGAL